MKRLYTGPFSAVYRNVWVERARLMSTDEWLWLLPTRHLLHTVRHQLMEGQAGLVDVPLLAFDDVAKALVQHSGRKTHYLNSYAREKIIESLLHRYSDDEHLTVFRPIMDQPGLYRSVAHAIGEMKRSGLTVEAVQNYLRQNKSGDSSEQRQLALAFLFLRYQEELYRDTDNVRLDPEESLRVACDVLEQHGTPPDVSFTTAHTLWVDHFTDFTPLQVRLLRGLIHRSEEVGIYIPFPHEQEHELPQLTRQLDETRRSLEQLGFDHIELGGLTNASARQQLQEDWLSQEAHFVNRDTGFLNSELGSALDRDHLPVLAGGAVPEPVMNDWRPSITDERNGRSDDLPIAPDGLECLPACTPKREVEMVAKEIKRLVRLQGVALHHIAIVVKDPVYEPLIHAVMQRDGVPLYAHERIGLLETAISRQLLALFNMAGSNWERRDVLCLAQGGYIDWQHQPPYGLETWVKKAGIEQGKRHWFEACTREIARLSLSERELAVAVIDEAERARQKESLTRQKQKIEGILAWLKEVEQLEQVLVGGKTWPERLERIDRVRRKLNVERRIKRLWSDALKEGNVQGYSRDLEAYHLFCDSLQELEALSSFIPFATEGTWHGLIKEFRHIATQKRVIVSYGQNGGVRLFDPSAIRGGSFEAVFILGLNEGSFPAQHKEDWLIHDAERVAFYEGQARLPASFAHNEMERLFFEMAVSTARRYLILSYVSPQANEEVICSRFLEQLQARYSPGPWLAPERFKEALESRLFSRHAEDISSPLEYRNWLMAQWGRSKGSQSISSLLSQDPLYRVQEQHMNDLIWHAEIEKERREGNYNAWDGHLLDPRIHDRLYQEFSPDRTYSVSWLNDYAACPLYFFFSRVLRVQPLEETEQTLSPLDTGNVLHESLRRLLVLHKGSHMCDRDLEAWQADLEAVFDEVSAEWETERAHMLSPLWWLEKERLLGILESWLQHEYIRQGRRRFKPHHLEFSFGLPLAERVDSASSEQAIALPLQNETLRLVGRIDRIDHDEYGNFVLYDYKLSTKRYEHCNKMERTTNFQLPLYALAYRQWLQAQGHAGQLVGVGFYGLRSQDKFKKIGLWDNAFLPDLGLDNTRNGVVDDVGEEAQEALPRVTQILDGIRHGLFYMLPEHEPNVYYGDRAVFRNDPAILQQKWRKHNETL